jgi:hypothetical protein
MPMTQVTASPDRLNQQGIPQGIRSSNMKTERRSAFGRATIARWFA